MGGIRRWLHKLCCKTDTRLVPVESGTLVAFSHYGALTAGRLRRVDTEWRVEYGSGQWVKVDPHSPGFRQRYIPMIRGEWDLTNIEGTE